MASASVDPAAPGLAELMQGEASFAQIITKDRQSRVQLVSAGRPGFDRAMLQSPRLTLAIDALLRVYGRVLLDAGSAVDLPGRIADARMRSPVVVPDAGMAQEARGLMVDVAQVRRLRQRDDAEQTVRRFVGPIGAGPRVVVKGLTATTLAGRGEPGRLDDRFPAIGF